MLLNLVKQLTELNAQWQQIKNEYNDLQKNVVDYNALCKSLHIEKINYSGNKVIPVEIPVCIQDCKNICTNSRHNELVWWKLRLTGNPRFFTFINQ